MLRLLFTKDGAAIWSSHLDLMRALMRSFRRAGIELKHSQGFTPHPELSILMPLSVGVESQCELAEFALAEGCQVPAAEIAARLDPVLPAGIRAVESYEGGQKAGKLAWLRARVTLTYEGSGIRDQGSGDEGNGLSRPSGPRNDRGGEKSVGGGALDAPQSTAAVEATGNGQQATGDEDQASDPPVGAVIGRPSFPASDEAAGDGDQASVTSHQSPDPLVGAVIGRPSSPASDEATGNGQQATGDGGNGLPRPSGPRNDRVEAIQALFARPSLVVEKHSKKGPVETDIAPMIREITVRAAETSPACRGGGPASRPVEGCLPSVANAFSEAAHSSVVIVEAVVAAQNPTLNPLLLVTAIETYLPQHKPDRVLCRRLEIYDADLRPFR